MTGGVLGLVHAMCGAIEYQANSTPHFHCNVYLACVWQQPLQKLADLLQAEVLRVAEVFDFQQWLHCEEHVLHEKHQAEVQAVEKSWLQNYRGPEKDALCLWPCFLLQDTQPSAWTQDQAEQAAATDAARFKAAYDAAVQQKLTHQQHHVHPWSASQQARLPLPACRKNNAPNKCKHGFPRPPNPRCRVICRGNARKFKLSTRHRRNALGTVLGRRHDPWLSGTCRAFALMLMGNSHTGLNYRVPLASSTHDPDCARDCLGAQAVRRLQRAIAQAARRATKYFTGYLQKPQPLGRKELQHAARQLSFLDTKPCEGKELQRYRQVVNRVLGDLEFRCSVRPLTEEFMLAGFWDVSEPSSAECIRSFCVAPFVGHEWLTQLDAVTEQRKKLKPHSKDNAEFKLSELYGWRGTDPRVYFLSPWEFVKWWEVKKLQPPSAAAEGDERGLSEWSPGRSQSMAQGQASAPADGWKFGRDYRWRDPLPPRLAASALRPPCKSQTQAAAAHYLQRRQEPVVPFPSLCPLPKSDMPADTQARFLNVYLRPWTLDAADASLHVPHITALDLPISSLQASKPRRRLLQKTAPADRSHSAAWRDYATQHAVSEHAARTIRNFLAAAECTPDEEDLEQDKKEKQCAEVDTTWVDVATVRRLSEGGGFQYSSRTAPAVRNIVQQWRTNADAEQVADLARCAGVPDPKEALGAGAGDAPQERPGEARAQPAVACVYGKLSAQAAALWLRNLHDPSTLARPSEEQQAFLQAVIDRCLREACEEAEDKPFRSEPLRTFLHGVPGAGKSQTLKWLRGFFEEICGWMQGQEFVYLASQNTQAALIDGNTLHSFAELQVKAPKQRRQTQFGPDKFVKYQRLRWLIVDECSTVALEVLAVLQKRLADWKCRDTTHERPFGGVNFLCAGDFWQFPAVRATSLFQNPFSKGVSVQVANLHRLFWTHGEDGMQRLFELTKEHRCVDPWLSHVLLQARHGRLSQEVWCFLHSYPTLHAGSWCPNSGQCDCKGCNGLAAAWQREIQSGTPRSWDVRVREECDVCATERERRRIVAGSARETPDPQAAKFLEGPFVHGFNAAKYVAALLRARWVAHERQHVLLWVVAQDTPLFQLEPEAAIGELQARKENWLQRHDQATGGIMGLLPLLPGMPVRVTQTLPELRPLRLFKNSRAKLLNWCLQDADAAAVQATTATEVVLQSMPTCLLIQVKGATWKQLPSLPAGVACIRPVQQHWKVAATGSATVLRRGFPVACDYAGAAHSFMGATLPACTLDLGFWDSTPSRDAQLSAYMCLSRVKRAEDLCVSRPFGPNLLGQGDLTGPRTLLETHRQTITLEEAKVRFQQEAKQRSRHPEVLLSCRLCSVARAGQESLKPLTAFLANEDAARFSVAAQGMDRVCRACRAKCPAGQSRQAECGDTLCAWCQGVPMTQPGLCKICSTKPLACSKCGDAAKKGQKRTLADFNLDEILRKKRTKELRRARCKQCEADAPIRATKAAKCKQCGHGKSRSHVTGLDSETNEGICRTCDTAAGQGVPAMRQRFAQICNARHMVRQLRLPAVPGRVRTRAPAKKWCVPRQKSPHLGLQQVCRQQVQPMRWRLATDSKRRLVVRELRFPAMPGRVWTSPPASGSVSCQSVPQLDLQPVCHKHVQPMRRKLGKDGQSRLLVQQLRLPAMPGGVWASAPPQG